MKEIHVVAGIMWQGSTYLAAQRPEGSSHAGYWEFPGGKIEAGETPEQALVREFQEEMNITPTAYSHWKNVRHQYETFIVNLYFFHITRWTGTLTALEGHTTRWLDYATASTLPFLEADLPLVEELREIADSAA